jgi:hypothetical protein
MAKLNSLLKEQFNMQLGGFPSRKKLAKLLEVAENNLVQLRGSNKKFQLDPEYAKFLGIKDIAQIMIAESMYAESPKYMEMKNMITASVHELMDCGYTMDEACKECMNRYRKDPRWVYDDEHVLPMVMMAAEGYMESCNMSNEQIEDAVMPTLESQIKQAIDEGDAAGARELMQQLKGQRVSEGRGPSKVPSNYAAMMAKKKKKDAKAKKVKKESMFADVIAELLNEEVDVESAEVVMAVRSLGDDVQGMVERLGKMINEDLPAITDQMRAEMGASTAQSFYDSTSASINQHLEATRQLKNTLDQSVNNLSSGGEDMGLGDDPMDPMAGSDMDAGMGGDDLDALAGDDTVDNIPAAAGPAEAPLGRAEV